MLEKVRRENDAKLSLLKGELDQKEQSLQAATLRVRQLEEAALNSSRVSGKEREDQAKAEKLTKEVQVLTKRLAEIEADRAQLKSQYEQMVAGLNDQIDRLKADSAKRKTNSGINNSLMDNDDVTILLVENENLKKKIKILENETSKQNGNEKSFKKNQEREAEVSGLREKIDVLEKKLVGLSGGGTGSKGRRDSWRRRDDGQVPGT